MYPFQDGFDANCFMTVGKSLLRGKVLYRDIYEHKGLYLYLLYGVCGYLLSHTTFLGIFLLEVVCGAVFLYFTWRILSLYVERAPLWLLPFFAVAVYSGDSFSYGGQTEELVLPLLAWGLYTFLVYGRLPKGEELSLRTVFAAGCFSAILFWMKYTLTGLYLGLVLYMTVVQIRKKGYRYLGRCAAVFLSGFLLLTLPVLIYFAYHHALRDLYEVYFYNLIFRYNDREIGMSRLEYSVRKFLLTMWRNKRYTLLLALGGVAFLLQKKEKPGVKLGLVLLGLCTVIPIYYSRQYNRYWGEVLAVYAVLGLIPIARGLVSLHGMLRLPEWSGHGLKVVSLAAALALARVCSGNVYLLQYEKEALPQFIFRDMIEAEQGTTQVRILNYESLDLGVYTVLDVVPDCKYFSECNIALDELYDAQDAYVAEGRGDYIVCRDPLEIGLEWYEEAAVVSYELEWAGYWQEYYLYRRRQESGR